MMMGLGLGLSLRSGEEVDWFYVVCGFVEEDDANGRERRKKKKSRKEHKKRKYVG